MARISRRDFKREGQHALNVNVRMRKVGDKPTIEEAEEVLQDIQQGGRVPKGWEIAVIRWTHAKDATSHWRSGDVKDLRQNFGDVIDYLLENITIDIDRAKRGVRVGVDRAKSSGDVWEIEIAMEY